MFRIINNNPFWVTWTLKHYIIVDFVRCTESKTNKYDNLTNMCWMKDIKFGNCTLGSGYIYSLQLIFYIFNIFIYTFILVSIYGNGK